MKLNFGYLRENVVFSSPAEWTIKVLLSSSQSPAMLTLNFSLPVHVCRQLLSAFIYKIIIGAFLARWLV